MKIINAANIPLNQVASGVPDMSGALDNWFQPMVFSRLQKTVSGYQVVESSKPLEFWGVIQPLSPRALMLKPEGQRDWPWFQVHAQVGIPLNNDDVVEYLGKAYRVMSSFDYSLYGYYEYSLVGDWTGSGP